MPIKAVLLATVMIVGSAAAQKPVSVQPRLATLQQQKMCAEQADKRFTEIDGYKPSKPVADVGEVIEHTTHFEAHAGGCYLSAYLFRSQVENREDYTVGEVLLQEDEVFDAFEGRRFARFFYLTQHKKYVDHGKEYLETAPVDCRVKPRGSAEIKCNSWAEYQDLIEKHFGIGR